MYQVDEEDGFIKVPLFNSKLRFTYESKLMGEKRCASIVKSSETNLFYVYFVEDDVDFKIEIDNTECALKNSACLNMEVLEKNHKVVLHPNEKAILNRLEPEGKNLHFITKKYEEQQEKIKKKLKQTTTDSKMNIHQIKFTIKYSKNHILNINMPEEEKDLKPMKLTVLPTFTIGELKKKIEKKRGIKAHIQNLKYRGKELFFNNQTIFQSRILNYDYITITRDTPVPIKIKILNKNKTNIILTTLVYPQDSLETLVQNVKKQEGISIKERSLYLRGIPILDHDAAALRLEDLTIEDLKLNKTDTILFAVVKDEEFTSKEQSKKQKLMTTQHYKNNEIYSPFPITIKNCNDNNKLFSIDVCGSDTIGHVKHKIQQQEKIPVPTQKLRFKNLLLQENLTLELYGIKEGSELKLNNICDPNACRNPGGTFIIKDLCGLTAEVAYYCGCDFIEELKDSIQYKLGAFIEDQKLIYDGKELMDGDQLIEYNIPNHSTIHLVRRSKTKNPFECNCIGQKRKCQMCSLNHTQHFDQRPSLISGRKTDKMFASAIDFVPDRNYTIESFVVEFRTYG